MGPDLNPPPAPPPDAVESVRAWRSKPDGVEKLFFVLIGLGAVVALVLAFQLEPDDRGYGTHEQLGLSPCGMMEHVGIPCPSCGMTTSWSLAAHGRILASVANQPFGALLFFAAFAVVPLSLYVLSGRFSAFNWLLEHRGSLWGVGFLILFGLSWIYKIWRVA